MLFSCFSAPVAWYVEIRGWWGCCVVWGLGGIRSVIRYAMFASGVYVRHWSPHEFMAELVSIASEVYVR